MTAIARSGKCILCRRDLHLTEIASPVCDRCMKLTRRLLASIPASYELAAGELAPSAGHSGSGSSSEHSIGINVAALDLRNGGKVLAGLEDLERTVRNRHNLTPYGEVSWSRTEAEIRAQDDDIAHILMRGPYTDHDVIAYCDVETRRVFDPYCQTCDRKLTLRRAHLTASTFAGVTRFLDAWLGEFTETTRQMPVTATWPAVDDGWTDLRCHTTGHHHAQHAVPLIAGQQIWHPTGWPGACLVCADPIPWDGPDTITTTVTGELDIDAIRALHRDIRSLAQTATAAARGLGRKTWRVDCPADVETEDGIARCGNKLIVSGSQFPDPDNPHDAGETINCRECDTAWNVERLLRVVAADTESDVWLPLEELQLLYPSVRPRTLRHWVNRGRVKRRGSMYEVGSVRAALRAPLAPKETAS